MCLPKGRKITLSQLFLLDGNEIKWRFFSWEKDHRNPLLNFRRDFHSLKLCSDLPKSILVCLISLKEIEEKYLQENESMNYERVASNEKNRCLQSTQALDLFWWNMKHKPRPEMGRSWIWGRETVYLLIMERRLQSFHTHNTFLIRHATRERTDTPQLAMCQRSCKFKQINPPSLDWFIYTTL